MAENKWSLAGIHSETGTIYGPDGYTKGGYDKDGYTRKGYNRRGFNKEGIHKVTGTKYDEKGYDNEGYDEEGYDKEGYDREGYDKKGYDREGYDKEGYNKKGYDREGYDKEGYDKKGYDREGYDKGKFDRDGIHKETKTKYNKEGWDKDGYGEDSYNANNVNRAGHTREEQEEIKGVQRKNFFGLQSKAEKIAKNELSIEEFIQTSKITLDELIVFAKKQKMPSDVIRGLLKKQGEYKKLKTPFNKEKYIAETKIMLDGQTVSPTEEDVNKCIDYLKSNDTIICDINVRKTVLAYLKGELEISSEEKEKSELASKEKEQQELQQEEQVIIEAEKLINMEKGKEEKNQSYEK